MFFSLFPFTYEPNGNKPCSNARQDIAGWQNIVFWAETVCVIKGLWHIKCNGN